MSDGTSEQRTIIQLRVYGFLELQTFFPSNPRCDTITDVKQLRGLHSSYGYPEGRGNPNRSGSEKARSVGVKFARLGASNNWTASVTSCVLAVYREHNIYNEALLPTILFGWERRSRISELSRARTDPFTP